MIINKGRIYVLTAIATLLYIVFGVAFEDQFFWGAEAQFFISERATFFDATWLHWLGLVAIIVAGVMKAQSLGDDELNLQPARVTDTDGQVDDPKLWKLLTGNIHLSIIWLPFRFYLGIHWLAAGWHKVTDSGWMDTGESLRGFLMGATTPNPETGMTRSVLPWYTDFLNTIIDNEWYTWFAPFVAVGEVLVGLGLIFGALVGIAAFFGTVMNMAFLLAGTVSSNPVMFGMTIFIILAWKVAGHYGLDRWLLPMLGTPWTRREAEGAVPANSYTARAEPVR